MLVNRVSYTEIKLTDDEVFIVDDQVFGTVSLTNAAEEVVKAVLHNRPGKRIIYRDTDNQWGELLHDGKKFTGFGEHNGLAH